MDTSIIWVVFACFLAVLIVITLWSRRESNSMQGYYVAGKQLPWWVVAFSTNATGESGWLLLGLTGMAYLVGVHALWVVAGEVIGIALSWMVVARRLKRATDEYGSITVPDYLESRFNDRRHVLRLISIAIILLMVGAYAAAQMVAAGKAFGTFLNMDYRWGVGLGALVTVVYTATGGFKAVAYTDVLQGVLMLLALVLIPIAALNHLGGWSEVSAQLAAMDASLLDPMGPHGWTVAGIVAVASFLAIGLPFMGVPQLMVRFISIRSEQEVFKAGVVSVVCIALFDLGAVMIGLCGRVMFPDLADAETILPQVSAALFPPIINGLVMVVVLAAIMSTVDSLLILASSAVVRDYLEKVRNYSQDDQRLARIGQWVTVIIGVFATLVALTDTRAVFWFVLFAWSGLGAAFGPVLLCSLYWRRTTRAGAIAGMLTGFLTIIAWVLFFKESAYELYEMVPAFFAAMLATVLVSLATQPDGRRSLLKL